MDEKGIVKWAKVYPMSQLPDIEEVFRPAREVGHEEVHMERGIVEDCEGLSRT